jgi:hypothetical protein
MLKYHDFQRHPAQLYIFEKTKQNKSLIELWEVFVNPPRC